ncbi:MAG: hypothetical protein QT07_C0005G0051 [archaeon GW2011_AR16]|nr:MAG: hypothetical protein QT07_C0005G0051 [archaeon GW2011_AR16]
MMAWEAYQQIKKHLDDCKKPLIFFDDDPDGTCSFLLFYRYKKEGKGIPLKTAPKLDVSFAKFVKEYGPDKVFVLDIPMIDQNFLDAVHEMHIPVVWVDHHTPLERRYVEYFNPRKENPSDSTCTTANAYYTIISDDPEHSEQKKELWIAAVGGVADWQLPEYMEEFAEKYPKLLSKSIVKSKKPEKALFGSPLGRIVKILSFTLKGKMGQVMRAIKIMTRLEQPEELLEGTTSRGRFLLKSVEKTEEQYNELLKRAAAQRSEDKFLIYTYTDKESSYTKEVSNELLYKFPNKIIVVGREKGGELKMSLRSKGIVIRPLVEAALQGVEGYGGGHEHACGACIKMKDVPLFLDQLRKGVEEAEKQKKVTK